MGLRSARFSGDPLLEQCAAGTYRMHAPLDSLSVLRVQEALGTLGYDAGALDGYFGSDTGAAVTAYKRDRGLTPDDPVVGPGTATALDADFFHDPPYEDPNFGEFAPYVDRHVMDPFVAFELNYLLSCPFRTVRRDIAFETLSQLSSGFLLTMVAKSRAALVTDPRLPPATKAGLSNLTSSAVTSPIFGPDGSIVNVAVGVNDTLLMGRRFYAREDGWRTKVDLRDTVCHEITHVRNVFRQLESTPDSDDTIYLDVGLAASLSASVFPTGHTFSHFVQEVVGAHISWLTIQEDNGNPFAARFLDPRALAEAMHFYFADADRSWFNDNGYMAACARSGDDVIYRQSALWLRAASNLIFSETPEVDQVSTDLFVAAADAADALTANPGATHIPPDGVKPLPSDFIYPPED